MLKLIFKRSQLWLLTVPRRKYKLSDFTMPLVDEEESKGGKKLNWTYKALAPLQLAHIKYNWETMEARLIFRRLNRETWEGSKEDEILEKQVSCLLSLTL